MVSSFPHRLYYATPMLVTGLDHLIEALELETHIRRFAASPPLGAAGDAEIR
jgi:hypothetical protein